MRWRDLKSEFEAVRSARIDAHWRYAPRESPHELWRITRKSKGKAAVQALAHLERAGILIDHALRDTRWVPPRLLTDAHTPTERWLAAIRRFGFNVERAESPEFRVDEGSIEDVVEASIALCEKLAASPTASAAQDPCA